MGVAVSPREGLRWPRLTRPDWTRAPGAMTSPGGERAGGTVGAASRPLPCRPARGPRAFRSLLVSDAVRPPRGFPPSEHRCSPRPGKAGRRADSSGTRGLLRAAAPGPARPLSAARPGPAPPRGSITTAAFSRHRRGLRDTAGTPRRRFM